MVLSRSGPLKSISLLPILLAQGTRITKNISRSKKGGAGYCRGTAGLKRREHPSIWNERSKLGSFGENAFVLLILSCNLII
jgi:hypothetical protein